MRNALYLTSALVMLPAVSVLAEEPRTNLDEITISAERNAVSVLDTPTSAAVVTQEELEEELPSSLGEAIQHIPGVDLSGGPRTEGEEILIRGLGGPRVQVRVDGARRNFNSGHDGRVFLDTDNLKQIEVMRGGGSSLDGSDALGGTLNVQTKSASDYLAAGETFGGELKLGGASADRQRNGTLTLFGKASDKLELVASQSFRRSEDIHQGGAGEIENSARDVSNSFFKASVLPDEDQEIHFTANHYVSSGLIPDNPQSAAGSSNEVTDRTTRQSELNLSYLYQNPDNDWLDARATVYGNWMSLKENNEEDSEYDTTRLRTIGLDVQNTSRFDAGPVGEHRVTVGGEVYEDDQRANRNGQSLDSRPRAEATTYGVFVQDRISVLDNRLDLIPALRYDSYERESELTTDDTEETQLSKKFGTLVRATPWLSLHGSYYEAFRAPSFIELYVDGLHFFGNNFIANPELKPESSQGYDLGFGMEFDDLLGDDRLTVKATYFDESIEDFINLQVTRTTSTYENVSEVERHGYELEAGYATGPYRVDLGAARIRAKEKGTGEFVDSTPADKVTVRLGYELPGNDVKLRWKSQLVARQERVQSEDDATSGYALHGLGVSWDPESGQYAPYRLTFDVDNLFDAKYRRHNTTLYEAGMNAKLQLAVRF